MGRVKPYATVGRPQRRAWAASGAPNASVTFPFTCRRRAGIGARCGGADRHQAAQEQVHAEAGRPARPRGRRPGRAAAADPARRQRDIVRVGYRTPPGARRSRPTSGIPEFQVHVQGRQRAGDQRVRAAGRPDVRQPRDDRGGQDAKGKWRASWRTRSATSRCATARRRRPRPRSTRSARLPGPCSARLSAGARAAPSRRGPSSVSARHSCDSAANSRSRPISKGRRSWRARGTTRARWRTCSRRSSSRAGPAARSG